MNKNPPGPGDYESNYKKVGAIPCECNTMWTLNQSGLLDKFHYCDSNIGLFSFASDKVITLPTLR